MADNEQKPRTLYQNAKHNTAKFLGLTTANEFDQIAWNNRRLRFAAKKYGGLKEDKLKQNASKTRQQQQQQQLLSSSDAGASFDVADGTKPAAIMNRGAVRPRLCYYEDHPLTDPHVCQPKRNVLSVASTAVKKRPQADAGIELTPRTAVAAAPEGAALDEEDGEHVHVSGCLQLFLCSKQTDLHKKVSSSHDYRPYFTYWVTFVQIVVLITSLILYGFAPIDFRPTSEEAYVLTKNLVQELVYVRVPPNFWIGMRVQDIVHLGARFAPCMRRDPKMFKSFESCAIVESYDVGCSIYADGSGCFTAVLSQTIDNSRTRFYRWRDQPDLAPPVDPTVSNSPKRVSGPFCGEDPTYCAEPRSAPPYVWPDRVPQWPICRALENASMARVMNDKNPASGTAHMACDIVARPCCVGVLAQCIITTREHCDFLRGYFHQDAFGCSHVDCLADVCGMIPFLNPQYPDQFYRLFLSLFLHAGVIPLVVTVLFQVLFMRDLEKVVGCLRMAVIYILSGMMGNLGSCIFLPYEAQTGPTSAQFGVLALGLVDLLLAWNILENPCGALWKYLGILIGLFLIGVLPWIDNFANLFGFISGFLISLILMPYFTLPSNKEDPEELNRRMKCVRVTIVLICLPLLLGILTALILLFYLYPVQDCEWCNWINCIPFTSTFCQTNFDINPKQPSCYIDETNQIQGYLT